MSKTATLTKLVETAAGLVRLKALYFKRRVRRTITLATARRQRAAAERDLAAALAPVMRQEVEDIAAGLRGGGKGYKFNPHHDEHGRFAEGEGAGGEGTEQSLGSVRQSTEVRVSELASRFTALKGVGVRVGPTSSPEFLAEFDGKDVVINEKVWEDRSSVVSLLRRGGDQGVVDSMAWRDPESYVASHECGHALLNKLLETNPDETNRFLKSVRKDIGSIGSLYSIMPGEAFPEAFAQYTRFPKEKWSPYTKKMDKFLSRVGVPS